MLVCVCPKAINNLISTLYDLLIILAVIQFQFMSLDVIDGRGPSNEMRHKLQPKKPTVALY